MNHPDEYGSNDESIFLEWIPWLKTPLDANTPCIRILKLHPGTRSGPIACSLQVVSLDDNPDYETLSYVWGDSKKTKPINVGGVVFDATENLFDFLTCLRHPTTTRILWADAICIDQSNNKEKGRQIVLMTRVYRQAKEVHIWFGPFTQSWTDEIRDHGGYIPTCEITPHQWDHIERSCLKELLSPFLKAGGKPQKEQELRHPNTSILPQTLTILDEVAGGKHLHEFPLFFASRTSGEYVLNRKWLEIRDCERWLLSRPWWTRVWTLQEAVLPRVDPVIHAYPHSFHLSRLLKGCAAVAHHATQECCKKSARLFTAAYVGSSSAHEFRADAVHEHRQQFAESEPPFISLKEAIDSTRDRNATAVQDHFFGVFGLIAPEMQEKWFEVFGYSCTTTETFSQCSKLIYDATKDLLNLGEARGLQESRLDDLPSWVIDLSAGIPRSYDGNNRWSLFNSSLDSKFEGVDEWHELAGRDLIVKGIPIGNVRACGKRLSEDEEDVLPTPRGSDVILRHVSEWKRLFEQSVRNIDMNRFWRTLFMDRNIRLYYKHKREPLPWSRLEEINEWWASWEKTGDKQDTYIPAQYDEDILGDFHYRAVKLNFEKHRFFCTAKGDPGMGPMETEPSDEIFVPQGCPAPAILRRRKKNEGEGGFSLIELCFVDMWMYGEAVRGGRLTWETLTLY